MRAFSWVVLALAVGGPVGLAGADEFPQPFNTQAEGEHPPTPEESVAGWRLPEGFSVTLFAGEPDVAQPIGMTTDARGRVWVVECYTYAEKLFEETLRDRIVILADTDGDGRHDTRTVFWDGGKKTTSVLPGRGGAFILNDGCLQFLPDADGDDRPDGPPVTLLDGFEAHYVGHNIASGLMWGPDGWIWGRHGIQATSLVGPPGASSEERTRLNCAIWRYHPERAVFEVVTSGTTNPWGLDYDEHGQFFFSNNVIGHLFHVMPGAHYKRMFGEDLNPHCYDLIDQHADHYHWDTGGGSWSMSGRSADALGGGHSHCGLMIYQGDNWPVTYRGGLFMCNTHGRRINHDAPVATGSGYVVTHRPDLAFAYGPWFRGVTLESGPDGGVFVSDWTDLGECHDHDGVHRTSGRIYKIVHGQPTPAPADLDLSKISDGALYEYQKHSNDWYARKARAVLADRFVLKSGPVDVARAKAAEAVRSLAGRADATTLRLRSLWTLAVTGGVDRAMLETLVQDEDPHLQIWAIRLLTETIDPTTRTVDDETALLLVTRGQSQPRPELPVQLALASALPTLAPVPRLQLAASLVRDERISGDHNLPLMIWYGIESAVPAEPTLALAVADASVVARHRTFVARRLASDLKSRPAPFDTLITHLAGQSDEAAADYLAGINQALAGWASATPTPAWKDAEQQLAARSHKTVETELRQLATLFGTGRAMEDLRTIATNASAEGEARREAVRLLIARRADGLLPLLLKLADDRATQLEAISGLAMFDDPAAADRILSAYRRLDDQGQAIALASLASRPAWAIKLLNSVERGQIPKDHLTAGLARQLSDLGDQAVSAKLESAWGAVRQTDGQRRAAIATWKDKLAIDQPGDVDRSRGQALFKARCGNCHKLFGEGEAIGPDLTGGNRDSLDYLLENIFDPSAIVPNPYRTTVFALADGRTITGIVAAETEETVTVRTTEQTLTLLTDEIEQRRVTTTSLMPEGLLENLSESEVRDLISYLRQKARPAGP